MTDKVAIEKIVHKKCGSLALQVWKKGSRYDGFCFKCHESVRNPYADMDDGYEPPKPKVKTLEDIQAELQEVQQYSTVDLPDRHLSKRVLQYFGVRTALSEENGQDVVALYFPYRKKGTIQGYKVRTYPEKQFFAVGSTSKPEPFGWQEALKAGGRKLFITEGEIDAMSLFRIIKTYSTAKDRHPAVISLSGGSQSVENLAPYINDIRSKFEEVIFVPDQDEAGKLAEDKLHKLLPTVKVANLPMKDVNEMLMAGRGKECFGIVFFDAKARLSGKMISSSTLWDLARERPAMGVSWPWSSLTKLTRGIRGGETIYLGAGKLYARFKRIELLGNPNVKARAISS